jgi:hypothetical protein
VNLTDVNLVSYTGGQLTLRNEPNDTLQVARIDRVTVETLPIFGGLCIAVYRLWTANAHRPDKPINWERPTEGMSIAPLAIAIRDHTFRVGANGRLLFIGKKNGDVGALALPGDQLFAETDVPEQYRS